jgi:hypothetical protein
VIIGLNQYAARGDGPDYIAIANALARGQLAGAHFPLYPAFVSVVSSVMPSTLAALAVPPAFHTATALIFYKILKHTGVKHSWLFSLTLSLFPPSMLIYSSSALSDAVTLFFTSLVFWYGLNRKEKQMLGASVLAASSHYYAILLIIPLMYWFWRTNIRKLPLALVPLLPLAVFSVWRFLTGGDLLYYLRAPIAPSYSWGPSLLTYPFGALVQAMLVLSGADQLYWLSYLILVYAAYGFGLLLATRRRSFWTAVFSAPFYLFSVLFASYYFVPRFVLLSFPSLMEFSKFEKLRAFRWILLTVIIASTAYAMWFLLIRVPASGFMS